MAERGTLTVQCTVTAEDYLAFNSFHLFRRGPRGFFLWRVMPVIMLALLVIAPVLPAASDAVFPLRYLLMGLAAAYLGLGAVVFFTTRSATRRFLATDKNLIGRPHTVTVTPSQARCDGPSGQTAVKWKDIHAAYETETLFLLYDQPTSAILIPRRDLQDAQADRLRSLLADKLGKRFARRVKKK